MVKIEELIRFIKEDKVVYIQTHNFPDHDAIASGFGLQEVLKFFDQESVLIYRGSIDRSALHDFIENLNIKIYHASEVDLKADDKIIIVDGCKGNKNVTDLIGEEIGVIDHHETSCPDDVKYYDIRPQLGSCASLIYSYYLDINKMPSRNVATALLMGLEVDTALMTRGVSEFDLRAFADLYTLADIRFVNSNLRNKIQVKDLSFFKKAIEQIRIESRFAFCYYEEGCNQNLLGIIGDFFLSLGEVDFVFLAAKNDTTINFSLRSEEKRWNAAIIIQEFLKKKGFGGGHMDMAGGIIINAGHFDDQKGFKRLKRILKEKNPQAFQTR